MPMRIYVYISQKDAEIMAFTSDATGGNLPTSNGPWIAGEAPDVLDTGNGRGAVSVAIRQDGYVIAVQQTHF
jgi:hypothetical protein